MLDWTFARAAYIPDDQTMCDTACSACRPPPTGQPAAVPTLGQQLEIRVRGESVTRRFESQARGSGDRRSRTSHAQRACPYLGSRGARDCQTTGPNLSQSRWGRVGPAYSWVRASAMEERSKFLTGGEPDPDRCYRPEDRGESRVIGSELSGVNGEFGFPCAVGRLLPRGWAFMRCRG
jgi:hypothetical protein